VHSVTLLRQAFDRLRHLFSRGIWQSGALADRSARGRLYAVLRIVSMTWTGLLENSLAARAGALSYSSMLGLGPVIAIAVLFSGIVLQQRADPDFAVTQLNRVLVFIAPQLGQMRAAAAPAAGEPAPATGGLAVNPELVQLLDNFVKGSQSKAIGLMGGLALIVIVIQLFSTIETAFNDIWGVRRGRSWMLRIVFYWTAITLGAVLAFASVTMLTASAFVATVESLPLGAEIRQFFSLAGPLISLGVLAALLTVFYKFIPNTSVGWRPAFTGALVAVVALWLNNLMAFVYLGNVVRSQSLYGSLGLLIVLMLGLYVFWLVLLVGGQATYAVQNVNYRSSRIAWADLNHTARQGLALLVLTVISRRFRACREPLTVPRMAETLQIPAQILNACLDRLGAMALVSRVPPDEHHSGQDYRYQPARPLEKIRLAEFKELFSGSGDGPGRDLLDALDPVVRDFHRRLQSAVAQALGDETMESLVARLPVESNGGARPASEPGPA
jgi:membrane protein